MNLAMALFVLCVWGHLTFERVAFSPSRKGHNSIAGYMAVTVSKIMAPQVTVQDTFKTMIN